MGYIWFDKKRWADFRKVIYLEFFFLGEINNFYFWQNSLVKTTFKKKNPLFLGMSSKNV